MLLERPAVDICGHVSTLAYKSQGAMNRISTTETSGYLNQGFRSRSFNER